MTFHCAAIYLAAFCLVAPLSLAQTVPTASLPAMHVTVGDKPAVLYDGLSTKADKIFVISRNCPLEVLVKLDKWTKVRDAEGSIGWVENSALGDRRFVQVSAMTADIRAAPSATAPMVFEAQRGVLLEVSGAAADGWVPVRHRDGQNGYVRSPQVWGI